MIGACNPSFKNGEVAFNCVCVCIASDIFSCAMIENMMLKVAMHMPVLARIVGYQSSFRVKLLHQYRAQGSGSNARGVDRPHAALPFNQRKHGFFAPAAAKTPLSALAAMAALFPCHR